MQLKAIWDDLPPATRVLLFLQTVNEVKMWAGARVGVEDTTQKGISTKLGVSVSRLSKLLAPLSADGLVSERRVKIPDLRRSPLAFSLTEQGTAATLEAMKGFLAKRARQLDTEGMSPELALAALCRALGLDAKTAEVTRRAIAPVPGRKPAAAGVGRPRAQRAAGPALVDLRDAVQISPHFVGRKKELAELDYFLKSGPARLFTVIGPAAIGKTSLVSRFVMSAMKSVSVAFHICREWDTLRNVLEPVAELLARMGRRRLQYFIQGELNPITVPDAAAILKTDLQGVSALLIFDDIQKLPFDYRPLLKVFLTAIGPADAANAAKDQNCVKVVTTSREPITGVFDHRELVVKELVREMELRGLSVEETLELLEKENAKGLPAEKVHRMTGGHPLYIELITRSGMTGAVRDFRKFMGTEVMGRLTPEERSVLGCLTVFRMPVPSSALQIPQATPETLDRLVKLGLVNETSPDEYLALDIVIETVYRALQNQDKRLYHAAAARYHRGLKTTENVAEAMHHLMLADDVLGALELGSENIHPVMQLGHRDLVEKVLEESRGAELPVRGIVAASKIRSELALASGEWRIAQIHLEKALAAVRGDAFQEGALLMAQANALREQGLMEEALSKFFEAEKAAKSVYDLPTMAGVYRGIGKIHWRMGDLDRDGLRARRDAHRHGRRGEPAREPGQGHRVLQPGHRRAEAGELALPAGEGVQQSRR
jgi:DNA-binding MarR family transcriptional regulator